MGSVSSGDFDVRTAKEHLATIAVKIDPATRSSDAPNVIQSGFFRPLGTAQCAIGTGAETP